MERGFRKSLYIIRKLSFKKNYKTSNFKSHILNYCKFTIIGKGWFKLADCACVMASEEGGPGAGGGSDGGNGGGGGVEEDRL